MLAVPVTYQSPEEQGHRRLPRQLDADHDAANVKPFLDDKSVEQLGANLEGAGYGLVVPKYVADGGVKDVADLGKPSRQVRQARFYGIEAGNDGNRIVQGMIDEAANDLKGWELVESSEQGMLAQAEKSMNEQGVDRVPRLDAASGDGQDGARLSDRLREFAASARRRSTR